MRSSAESNDIYARTQVKRFELFGTRRLFFFRPGVRNETTFEGIKSRAYPNVPTFFFLFPFPLWRRRRRRRLLSVFSALLATFSRPSYVPSSQLIHSPLLDALRPRCNLKSDENKANASSATTNGRRKRRRKENNASRPTISNRDDDDDDVPRPS